MNIPQDDLIKFWTWCGFTQYPQGRKNFHYEQTFKVMDWIYPKGHYGMGYLPQLELTEIFTYAIPKLQENGYNLQLDSRGNKFHAIIFNSNEKRMGLGIADNPTEALYKAIMEVINANNTKGL